jgi:hypothetical protein
MASNFTPPPVFEIISCDGDTKSLSDNNKFIEPMNLFDSNVSYLTDIVRWLAKLLILWTARSINNRDRDIGINLARSVICDIAKFVTQLDEQLSAESLLAGEPSLPKRLYRISQWSDDQLVDYYAHLEHDDSPVSEAIENNQDLRIAIVNMRTVSDFINRSRLGTITRVNYLSAIALCDVIQSITNDAEDTYLTSRIEWEISTSLCEDDASLSALTADLGVALVNVQLARDALVGARESQNIARIAFESTMHVV